MQAVELENLKKRFESFIADFYCDDEFINDNLKSKQCHTYKTCEEMRYLTDSLEFTAPDAMLAQAVALLHDVGRFPQFATYKTYTDHNSESHCDLGVEAMSDNKMLDGFDGNEKEIIQDAVQFHGLKKLPGHLDGRKLRFCKLIRDADKLDIYRLFVQGCKQIKQDPDSFKLEVGYPDEPSYSPEMIQAVLTGKQIDYRELRTLNDMKLLQITLMYDINFAPALVRIKERQYLENIIELLPRTEDIKKIYKKMAAYIDERIMQN